jgi:hypothetical protein
LVNGKNQKKIPSLLLEENKEIVDEIIKNFNNKQFSTVLL